LRTIFYHVLLKNCSNLYIGHRKREREKVSQTQTQAEYGVELVGSIMAASDQSAK